MYDCMHRFICMIFLRKCMSIHGNVWLYEPVCVYVVLYYCKDQCISVYIVMYKCIWQYIRVRGNVCMETYVYAFNVLMNVLIIQNHQPCQQQRSLAATVYYGKYVVGNVQYECMDKYCRWWLVSLVLASHIGGRLTANPAAQPPMIDLLGPA